MPKNKKVKVLKKKLKALLSAKKPLKCIKHAKGFFIKSRLKPSYKSILMAAHVLIVHPYFVPRIFKSPISHI